MILDPSAAGLILSLGNRNVPTIKGINDVKVGLTEVTSLLAGSLPDGSPLFTVDPSCVATITEFESYQYPENRQLNSDAPVKANDHAMDALRYAVMHLAAPPVQFGIW